MGSDSAFARIITDMAMAEPSLKTHDKHTNNRMWYKPRGQINIALYSRGCIRPRGKGHLSRTTNQWMIDGQHNRSRHRICRPDRRPQTSRRRPKHGYHGGGAAAQTRLPAQPHLASFEPAQARGYPHSAGQFLSPPPRSLYRRCGRIPGRGRSAGENL